MPRRLCLTPQVWESRYLNELATECGVPVPPISASKPIDMMTSCSAFLRNWYLAPIPDFPSPICGLSPAGSILLVPISTPSQGVTSLFPAGLNNSGGIVHSQGG